MELEGGCSPQGLLLRNTEDSKHTLSFRKSIADKGEESADYFLWLCPSVEIVPVSRETFALTPDFTDMLIVFQASTQPNRS